MSDNFGNFGHANKSITVPRPDVHFSLNITTQPDPLIPVTIGEVKDQSRVEFCDDDTILRTISLAASQYIAARMRRAFIETEFALKFDFFPNIITPPVSPLISVENIQFIDNNDVTQTVDSSIFVVDTSSEPGRIIEAEGKSWPTPKHTLNAVTVNFKAGFGTKPEDTPESIKAAIKLLTAHWYENREAFTVDKQPKEVPMAIESLIWINMVPELA